MDKNKARLQLLVVVASTVSRFLKSQISLLNLELSEHKNKKEEPEREPLSVNTCRVRLLNGEALTGQFNL